MKNRYDVVIVGARCAGASTALLLARAGVKVLVIDKTRYGTDTVSTHALMRGGALQLARWGLIGRVRASGAPAINQTNFHYGGEPVTIDVKPRDGVDALYAPRRTVLDAMLVDAARDAGAEFLFGARLDELLKIDNRVIGVSITHGGTRRAIHADRVVGADGAGSTVARLVGAETERAGTSTTACVLGYFENIESDGYQWYFGDRGAAGVIPTNGGHCIFITIPSGQLPQRGSLEPVFAGTLSAVAPRFDSSFAGGRRIGGLRSFRGRLGHMKRAAGPGWALVGDAGYFKDPLTAHGITDALRDAELLAGAIASGTEEAVYEYQRIRDELSRTLFALSDTIASFDWTLPELAALHYRLNLEMKREVRYLLSLDEEQQEASLRSA